MLMNIPPEITIASFSLVGILTGYVWNDQNKRIIKIEEEQTKCPFPKVRTDLAIIKTDLKWLKEEFKHIKK